MRYDVVIVGGFGHVGLPLAISLADRGRKVCAFDINEQTRRMIADGKMPFHEDGAELALRRVLLNGNLTLSLIDGMRKDLSEWSGFRLGINYGWNKVRFPAPVLAGARVCCYAQIVEIADLGDGWHQVVTRYTLETEGSEKPVCVADGVGRVLVDA